MWKSECFTVGFFLAAKEMSAIFMQNSSIEHEFLHSKRKQNNYAGNCIKPFVPLQSTILAKSNSNSP